MTKAWADVANSPEFQQLAPTDQEAARQQYFQQVVAPRVPAQDLDTARSQFDGATRVAAPPAPTLADQIAGGIKSAASTVADVASDIGSGLKADAGRAVDGLKSAFLTMGQAQEQGDAVMAGAPIPAPVAPAPRVSPIDTVPQEPMLHVPDNQPYALLDDEKSPARVAAERQAGAAPQARSGDQDAARRQAWDTVPQGTLQAGYNVAAGRAGDTVAHLTSALGDATDSPDLRDWGRRFHTAADLRINRAMQGNEDSDAVKTVAGVFSLAPLLAGSGPGISAMVTQAGVDGYGDARQAGDSPAEAVGRGTAMALANYVGMRVQIPGITQALTKVITSAPAGEAIAALGHALATNVGGMEATTVLGDLYDKMAPGGLRPNMTAGDMVRDIADTAKSATLLTLAVPGAPLGAAHLYGAAHALAHGGRGNVDVANAIDGTNPPAAGAPTTSADTTAAAPPAPDFSAPVGLDTLHNSIDEAARTVGLSPKATAALRDAAANQDPQAAPAFVARAFHRFEANGLTTKPGAPGAFRDALAQRITDQQPEAASAPAAAAPAAPAARASVADQLAAIRPLESAAPAESTGNAADQDPAAAAPITPEAMAQANDIADAAHQAATSPFNERDQPTDAQKSAGNYAMGHVQLHGLDVTIENPQGSTRSGVSPDGTSWSNDMAAHYGYIKGTHASDGDHVDTFIGPNPESKTAFVIDQVDPNTGKFDEPKTILGADSEQQARQLYAANYADGWNGLGAITALPMDAFKSWVRDGVKDQPLGDISQWKPTDGRAQPDLEKPTDVAPGAGDGGGDPAVAGGGDSRPDSPVGAGRDIGGDAPAPAPAGRARASDAVGGRSAPDKALTPAGAVPNLLGKLVTDYETPALQKIAAMTSSSLRARDVAGAELTRRANEARASAAADVTPATKSVAYEGKGGVVFDEEALQRRNLTETLSAAGRAQLGEHAGLFDEANRKAAEASFDKDGTFTGEPFRFVPKGKNGSGIRMFKTLAEAKDFADTYGQKSTPPAPPRKRLGKNERGNTVFENEQGVRSYTDSGFKHEEQSGKPRDRDFMTAAEAAAGGARGESELAPLLSAHAGAHDTPEFKKWFGESKVVDADGQPQVVFHGTNKTEDGDAFTVFDSYAADHGLFGQGSYFTADPKIASDYTTKGRGDSPTVYPVYLSIKHPIDMDARVTRNLPDWQRAFPDVDFENAERAPRGGDAYTNEDFFRIVEDHLREERLPKWEGAEIMQEGLRKMGYDGVTHVGGGRIKGDSTKHRVYIAFDPEQVKSATGNRGAFDASSADIRLKQVAADQRAGIDSNTLRTEVDRIQAGWKDAPPVHVVDDVNGLPHHIQAALRSQGAEGKTRGLFMPGKGSDPGDVYLISNRLKDTAMAQRVLFHEVLGHYGMRKVLGSDAQYFAEMFKLRQANPELAREAEAWYQAHGRGAIADQVARGKSMDIAVRNIRALSTEEALADRAGRGEPIRGLQSLMAKIQAWLRSVGLDKVADHIEGLTQAETASLLSKARSTVEADGPIAFGGDEDAPRLSQRGDSPIDLPDAVIAHPLSTSVVHQDYAAAKGGDPVAAHRLAEDLVTPDVVERVRAATGSDVIVQPVISIEASGRNKIPSATAHVLAARLGAEEGDGIVQSNAPKRTGLGGEQRLLSSPEFDGPVRTDKPYVLLDDTLTQGGTLASLASHIEQNGGKVTGVVALTGKQYSAKLKLSPELLGQVRDRYSAVEPDFRAATGRGFDSLTESEARYLAKHKSPEALRDRIVEAGGQARSGTLPDADGEEQAPLLSQHAAGDDSEVPTAPAGHAAAVLAKVREATTKFADVFKQIRDDALLKVVPMALGTAETRTIAKDFANADRLARWQWGKFDDVLKKSYDEAQRMEMWEAADQENVLRQQDRTPGPKEGLNRLTPDQRATMDTLHNYGEQLLQRAKDVGMFQGEGLPYWTPRMAVMIDGKGEYARPKGAGAETGAAQGRNIVTSASSLKGRKHLTSEDTEAAMKGKLGDGAQLVRDIRTMPLAMARLERAIAGRELVNNIKAMGQRAGLETVSNTEQPGFFTVDHPAFKTWQVRKDENGTQTMEAKPLYVNKAFQGPLKAVMSETPGPIYSALMSLKAKSMGLIMYSPLIHNAVEWGRALPAMPGKVATFQIYFEGNRIKNDPEQMRQAINDGLVPIGRRGGIQDITGIMEDPTLQPGRSWTAKLIGGALGLANEKAGTAAKKGIDAAGDFWHNTLLWDRVGDLQAGLYGALRDKEIAKGVAPDAAGKLAAHFANRFAGALPNEAMSAGARKVANILMFSRTFTLGNLGLMKDMISGLPRDIQSQIRTQSGELAAAAATSRARRIAIASFIVDIGLMYVGNSILQDTINRLRGKKSWGEIGQGYLDRLHKLLQRAGDHPLDTLSNPFDVATSMSSTSENEPGKEDRIRVGTQDDGTAIYARLPTGKVGEDFKNWITKPLVTAKAKESQLVRPLQQIWNNDNGIGQRIYDPDAQGVGGVVKNAGRIATLFATQMIPADAIQGALDWKSGKASDADKLKVVGPLAGITFSKGAPGGPEVGAMYEADRKYLGAKMDVMPDVKRAIKDGDDQKAIDLMLAIKMTPAEINSTLRRLEVPEARFSTGAFRNFRNHASDEDMQRMMDLLQNEKPAAAEPAPAP